MENHDISPRTEREDTAMKNESDPAVLALVRDRLQAGCETFEMLDRWARLPVRSGATSLPASSRRGATWRCSHRGRAAVRVPGSPPDQVHQKVLGKRCHGGHPRRRRLHPQRCALRQYPQYRSESDHADLSNGQADRMGGATVHEGENGAIEPGGMPSAAERLLDEGLENVALQSRREVRTQEGSGHVSQNSVREPKLQYTDMKVKYSSAARARAARQGRYRRSRGPDAFIAALRSTVEDSKTEVQRRIGGMA